MNILKTKTHVDNLNELRQRKAELKARLDTEQAEIRADWQELRSELRPSKLMANFAQSLLNPPDQAGAGASGFASSLQGPLRMATDLLIGDTRSRVLLKIVTPLVLTYLPKLAQKVKGISLDKSKAKVYGTLRKGVAGLRSQFTRKKRDAPQETDTGDIIQPS
ncbi:MAG TPA: hypothetical protein PK228_09195 [Saprospiraceae bacterium]|nr:hypothetical protein [Saprospiraceae bacterium]